MAQADQSVQNATFPTVRADINNNLAALFSANSGNTAPSVTVAFQDWIDTSGTDPLWKKRNAANNAWITVATITGSTIAFEGTLPSQSGNAGEYLTTDGTVATWEPIPATASYEAFTSSGTWTKPAGATVVLVYVWGGGGSGGRGIALGGGGGGGGCCTQRLYRADELASSVTVTIGAGGAAISSSNANGLVGGNSSFGSLTGFGGGPGGNGANGGGGGGSISAGAVSNGGNGHGTSHRGANNTGYGDFGGGGGGNATTDTTRLGGNAYYGGAGGGGIGTSSGLGGGVSLLGGNGATSNDASTGGFPGGGGGGARTSATSGAGGAGYCLVYVW
jgi:hypothetical protein